MMLFAVSLWIYITNVDALIFSRVMTGFFNVFFCIFFPVWVDLHGLEKKTLWLTLLQVAIPLGVIYLILGFFRLYYNSSSINIFQMEYYFLYPNSFSITFYIFCMVSR